MSNGYKVKWHLCPLWQLVVALSRGGISWWHDPNLNRPVLRSKRGITYDMAISRRWGTIIRRRYELTN